MVLKAKIENVKPIRNVSNYRSWRLPDLDLGEVANFCQPKDESEAEPEIAEETVSEELAAIREQARIEGYEAGKQQGLAAAEADIQQKLAALDLLLTQLSKPLQEIGEQTEQQLLQLAFAIGKQIVRRELQTEPTQIIGVIREAVKLLPIGTQSVRVLLNPEDAKVITEALNIDAKQDELSWQIVPDPSLARGDCRILAENSKVEATIDQQVAVLFQRLVGGQRAGEDDAD